MNEKPVILQTAKLQWREETPLATEFDDFYYSTDDGLEESDYIFLQHNQIAQRFVTFVQANAAHSQYPLESEVAFFLDKPVFRIAETGFGTGLNFLLVLRQWCLALGIEEESLGDFDRPVKIQNKYQDLAEDGKYPVLQLHYIAFEKQPMQPEDLQRSLNVYPQLKSYCNVLLANYPDLLPGWHEVYLFSGRVRLSLWFGDANQGLAECDPYAKVDAWLLDGFAPVKNPEMWNAKLYQAIARLSDLRTTFATFTAAGDVRRGLQAVGFDVQKATGYGKKREMCFGKLQQLRPSASKTPWFELNSDEIVKNTQSAIVVGAGLAGATTAFALAQAGYQVRVLEQHSQVANEASGNLAGTLHPLVTVDWNLRSAFYQLGYEASQRWLAPWLAANKIAGNLSGIVQLAATETAQKRLQEALCRVPLSRNYAKWLASDEAAECLGSDCHLNGLFFPNGGWIYPRSVIEYCLAHPNIEVVTDCVVVDFQRSEQAWQVETLQNHSEVQLSADHLVFATGSLANALHQKLGLPIRPVKGQVSHLAPSLVRKPLNFPVTHSGYSSPTADGAWVCGATFEAPDLSTELSLTGHQHNIAATESALPEMLSKEVKSQLNALKSDEWLQGRIAFRPTTPDHLPVIGAVPDWEWVQTNYCQQSHTHAVYRYPRMQYQPNLYVNNGHGPRGLMSVFLAAEVILAQISGRSVPMPQSLRAACHPARFVVRQWRAGNGCSAES